MSIINFNPSAKEELDFAVEKLENLLDVLKKINEQDKILKFVDIEQVMKATGFSKKTVQDLFKDPEFPTCNYGKKQIAEVNAVIKYFSSPRRKEDSVYWRHVA